MQKSVAKAVISKIVKRDGQVVDFDSGKITSAIFKAAVAVGGTDIRLAEQLTESVIEVLEKDFRSKTPTVEDVQDIVEKVLIESGHAKTAKAYILYRQNRAAIRKEKTQILEKEELDEVDKVFDVNALRVLKARYLRKDDKGRLIETPKQLFTRVAVHTALPSIFYDSQVYIKNGTPREYKPLFIKPADYNLKIGSFPLNEFHVRGLKRLHDRFYSSGNIRQDWEELVSMIKAGRFDKYELQVSQFYNIMTSKRFLPNTPAIANFGNVLGMGSACFVLGIEDSMESIMQTLTDASFIFKAGGGVGYNFSNLRYEGDYVKSTSGVASGPISFIGLFDKMTDVIKQGGIRRGANMGILNSNHPDIEKFITAKEGNKQLRNFNISVLIMDDFWEHYEKNTPYPLVSPRTKEVVRTVNPRLLFDRIVYQAWESAEPGVIFFDKANEFNPFLKHLGPIVTTNPCVAADSLISTESGLERIDSIKAESIIVDKRAVSYASNGLLSLQYGSELVRPLQRIKTGYKECYKLETVSGYEITATPDHRILTVSGWKELKDLTEEDHVLIQSGEGSFSITKELPFEVNNKVVGKNGRAYEFNLPSKWSRELGMVLGWITGDGFVSTKYNQVGLVFAKEDNAAKELIKPVFESYCNRAVKEIHYPNGCIQIRSASRHVVDFFIKLGVSPADEERSVPKALFTAPREAVIGFLEGLFSSDGTIGIGSRSRKYVRLNSSSLKLLKQVQLLLLNLGMRSSIYDRSTHAKVFRYVNKRGDLIKYKTSGVNYELNISKASLLRLLKLISFTKEEASNRAAGLMSMEFYADRFAERVKSKEHVGIREVWDITEPMSHSFISNGIVVHNCGEVLLYPNESCNLGSINVWRFAEHSDSGVKYDWDLLRESVVSATIFLDNVIDVNLYPLQSIEEMTLSTRKIGLGIMGVGDLLYELGLPYNSEEGRKFMEKLMEFINYHSKLTSIQLAQERGSLPFYSKSFYTEGKLPISGAYGASNWGFDWNEVGEKIRKIGIRNGYTTVLAPTGSISMIAGVSSGMEPVYSLVFQKNVAIGSFYYANHVFERAMSREGLYDEKLMADVNDNRGGCRGISYIPSKLKKVFVTAMDLSPEDHIRALAAFQKWTDSSISKTNNFPADATVEDMRQSYLLAYRLGCKDVTVFRDSSIKEQALVAPKKKEESDKCPECSAKMEIKEGCAACPSCGFSVCSTS